MKRTSLTDLKNEMVAVARGEREPPLAPASVLLAALSPAALALLQTILQDRPETIAKLAELTERAQAALQRHPEILTQIADEPLDLAFRGSPVGPAQPRQEAVVAGEVAERRLEAVGSAQSLPRRAPKRYVRPCSPQPAQLARYSATGSYPSEEHLARLSAPGTIDWSMLNILRTGGVTSLQSVDQFELNVG